LTYQSGTPISISFDPQPISDLYAWDDNPYSSLLRPLPEGDGKHVLHVQVEDSNSNFYTGSFTFYTDDTPPVIDLEGLSNNSYIQSWTQFSFSTSSDFDTVQYYWDDNPSDSTIVIPSEPIYTTNVSGWHTLTFLVNDTIGNEASYAFQVFTIIRIGLSYPVLLDLYDSDTSNSTIRHSTGDINIQPNTSIICNFSDIPDTVFYNWWVNDTTKGTNETSPGLSPISGLHKLSIYANDSFGFWHVLDLEVTIDGSTPYIDDPLYNNRSALIAGTSILFNYSEPLHLLNYEWDGSTSNSSLPSAIGQHSLNLTISDYAFNSRSYQFIYYTKYNVSLDVVNGSSHKGSTLFTVFFDPSPLETRLSWDGLTNTSSISPLPDTSGYHTLNIYTRDPYSNWYIDTFTFQTILQVNLTSPLADSPTQSNVSVTFSMSETPLTTLYSWDFGTWSAILKDIPSDDGNHSLRVWVENSDLPDTQWFLYEFNIMVDNTPPSVTTLTIDNNSRINYYSDISFTFSEALANSFYNWNISQDWSNSTALPDALSDGPLLLTINTSDLAGNIAFISYIYILDTSPVTITLNYPINNTIIVPRDFSSFNISFSEDPAETVYYPSWTQHNGSEIPALPYYNDSIFLTVYAFDGLNWCSVNYTFTLQHFIGRLINASPANNSIIGPSSSINFTWSEHPETFYWRWNSSTTNSTGQCLSPSFNGNYTLYLYYQDLCDFWLSYNLSFTIDADPPTILSMYPFNNSYYSSKYSLVNFTFDENISTAYFRWNVQSNWTSYDLNASTINSILLITIPEGFNQNLTLSLQVSDKFGNTIYLEYNIIYHNSNVDFLSIALTGLFISLPFVALTLFFKIVHPYLKSRHL